MNQPLRSSGRRLISYRASPAPAPSSATRRQNYSRRFFVASIASASAVTLYYTVSARKVHAETSKDYSTTIRKTDTVDHPRNFKMTVTDATTANTILQSNECVVPVTTNNGIMSYFFNQVASNSPIEDDHVELIHTGSSPGSSDWAFFGTFDGHSGWTTSDKLKRELVPTVINALNSVYRTSEPNSSNVNRALQSGFLDLDRQIVYKAAETVLKETSIPKAQAIQQLMPALSGSCALLAFYDCGPQMLHVAVTGDSRAIYGSSPSPGICSVRALSEDQTGSTKSEVRRLQLEHPNEENVIRNGRILGGLEPSRAFGDARYKWSASVQSKISEKFYGRRPPAALVSPPYVTARPEVTSTKINMEEDGFLVLGTDGLYEMLTNEEIAELVYNWRQKYGTKQERQTWVPSFLRWSDASVKIVNEDDERSGQKTPRSASKKKFVYEDENVSTHIIRNALGGGDTNRLYGLLSLPYPLSRSYRDDISVTVVFFGKQSAIATEKPSAKL